MTARMVYTRWHRDRGGKLVLRQTVLRIYPQRSRLDRAVELALDGVAALLWIALLLVIAVNSTGCASADGYDSPPGSSPSPEAHANSCTLPPGDYAVEYTVVSDSCGIGPLSTELLTVLPGGGVAQDTETPDGCSDSEPILTPIDGGCIRSMTRRCLIPTAYGELQEQVSYTLNLGTKTGSVALRANLYDADNNLAVSCVSSQRATVTGLN